ncbi:MAG: hypothetical protein HYY05_08560 [Chloroflexi bacterium]|nr:hypothetical protein [Chloroflexota bacterium]
MERLLPRFRWGNIAPFTPAVDRGPGHQFYQIVPLDVMEIVVSLGLEDYTPQGVEAAIGNFGACVALLAAEGVDRVVLGAAPVSAQLGRTRVRRLLDEAERTTGIPGDAPLEAVIAAMARLGLRRIAVGSKWADQLNDRLRAYLEEGGLEVLAITARGRWAKENAALSYEDGFQAALEVAREAARLAPQAEAIYSAGGPARTLPVIPVLEEEVGKPVLTNLSAEVWHGLVHTGVIPPVLGWGRLLASP